MHETKFGTGLTRRAARDVEESEQLVSCAPLETFGAWFYRRLHWEAGVVGQQLYLEAEASGIRATGIGCFFDDVCHRTFEITGDGFQVLYHFTMGGAIDDVRLQTVPPYPHLAQ